MPNNTMQEYGRVVKNEREFDTRQPPTHCEERRLITEYNTDNI